MAARGSPTKEKIQNIILQVFPRAFLNGKELRICGVEDGEEVQIKITMTAAKENINGPGPVEETETVPILSSIDEKPTEEELMNVRRLIEKFHLF